MGTAFCQESAGHTTLCETARPQVRKLAGSAKAWTVVGAADITSTGGLEFGETHTPGQPFRWAAAAREEPCDQNYNLVSSQLQCASKCPSRCSWLAASSGLLHLSTISQATTGLPPPTRSFDNLRVATLSSGLPVISFTDSPTGAVLRFDGTRWRNVGRWGLVGPPYDTWRYINADMDLAVGSDDTIYVVHVDGSESQRGTCLAFRKNTAGQGAWLVSGGGGWGGRGAGLRWQPSARLKLMLSVHGALVCRHQVCSAPGAADRPPGSQGL